MGEGKIEVLVKVFEREKVREAHRLLNQTEGEVSLVVWVGTSSN